MAERIEVTVEEAQVDFERLLEAALTGVGVVIASKDGFRAALVVVEYDETD